MDYMYHTSDLNLSEELFKTDKPKTSSFTLLDIKNPSVNGPKKGFGAKQK